LAGSEKVVEKRVLESPAKALEFFVSKTVGTLALLLVVD